MMNNFNTIKNEEVRDSLFEIEELIENGEYAFACVRAGTVAEYQLRALYNLNGWIEPNYTFGSMTKSEHLVDFFGEELGEHIDIVRDWRNHSAHQMKSEATELVANQCLETIVKMMAKIQHTDNIEYRYVKFIDREKEHLAEIRVYQNRINMISEKLTKADTEYKQMLAKKNAEIMEIYSRESALKAKIVKFGTTKTEIAELQKKAKNLEEEKQTLNNDWNRMYQKLATEKAEALATIDSMKKNFEKERIDFQKKIAKLEEKNHNLEVEINNLKNMLNIAKREAAEAIKNAEKATKEADVANKKAAEIADNAAKKEADAKSEGYKAAKQELKKAEEQLTKERRDRINAQNSATAEILKRQKIEDELVRTKIEKKEAEERARKAENEIKLKEAEQRIKTGTMRRKTLELNGLEL